MPKNKMVDLRNHLFVMLESLADKEKPMEIERAHAICEVAQTLINSAKVEVQFLEATGQHSRSEFMESDRLLEDAKPAAKRNGVS